MKSKKKDHDIKPIAFKAFLLVISLFVIWILLVFALAPHMKDFAGIGTFGDAFGVINALFSGLALAAVAVTLWLSLKQLKVQQAELKQNTEAVEGSRDQLKIHNDFLEKQSVQNQFFQMLESWQNITHNLEFRPRDQLENVIGRVAIVKAAEELLQILSIKAIMQDGKIQKTDDQDMEFRRELINNAYTTVAMREAFHLGNYFRLFYHIIRMINKSTALEKEEKRDLVRVLRAHLSEAELVMLLYNCVTPYGEKLRIFVEDYDLLQNLGEHAISKEIDLDFFPDTKARWEKQGNLRSDK